jgi:hypothetical protein
MDISTITVFTTEAQRDLIETIEDEVFKLTENNPINFDVTRIFKPVNELATTLDERVQKVARETQIMNLNSPLVETLYVGPAKFTGFEIAAVLTIVNTRNLIESTGEAYIDAIEDLEEASGYLYVYADKYAD